MSSFPADLATNAFGLESSSEQVQALTTLYAGVLFSLVTAPPGH
jgi:hypothetical protein